MNSNKDVSVVMPLYNESKGIEKIIYKWINVLEKLNLDYSIEIFNDGSIDNSSDIIEKISKDNPYVKLHNYAHFGFSRTLYNAYKNTKNSEYIFHADSDNDICPEEFIKLWKERDKANFIIGKRMNRKQTLMRKIATVCASFLISIFFSNGKLLIHDANIPFKLVKSSLLKEFLDTIDCNFPYPDLFLCAYCLKKKLKIIEIPVEYQNSNRKGWLNNIITLHISEIKSVIALIFYKLRLKK